MRSCAHRCGYRFGLRPTDLPGKPDLVFRSRKAVIFVHGCFWHQHGTCIDGSRIPKTNRKYWSEKLRRNKRRDARVIRKLKSLGWKVLIVWECQAVSGTQLASRLRRFFGS